MLHQTVHYVVCFDPYDSRAFRQVDHDRTKNALNAPVFDRSGLPLFLDHQNSFWNPPDVALYPLDTFNGAVPKSRAALKTVAPSVAQSNKHDAFGRRIVGFFNTIYFSPFIRRPINKIKL
jgi:hypothetical protein